MPHRGTHSRGYLPHRDYHDSIQAITFRLADSLPRHVIDQWNRELRESLASTDEQLAKKAAIELHRRIARYEDASHGACHLREPEIASIVVEKLKSGHPADYRLIDWCVMPNHVHALIRLTGDKPLGEIVQAWKGGSAIRINRLLSRKGRFWARDFHDRFIRNEKHFHNACRYIHQNPVKAGLCGNPEDWPHSSIGSGWNPVQWGPRPICPYSIPCLAANSAAAASSLFFHSRWMFRSSWSRSLPSGRVIAHWAAASGS